ncbi:hypothetical protein [Roseovarius aestuariivivens]|uniref:hypothetical protein n=1 Tax=Roseovarius aestuariivivens TaxID=1888910 RepID=UPI0010809C16|nr:hypothetical protein [Roseovarius aestuariivivens]
MEGMTLPKDVVLSAFVISIFAVPANAQQQFSPGDVWARFAETCGQVISDPDGYIDGLERPGALGERVISESPDGKAVSIYYPSANAYDEVEIYVIGEREVRDCSVIGQFYSMDTSQLASDFREIVAGDTQLAIAGGHAPQDYSEEGSTYTVEEIYLFAIDGLWPEQDLVTVAHVIGGELQLMVQQIVN